MNGQRHKRERSFWSRFHATAVVNLKAINIHITVIGKIMETLTSMV